MAVELQTGEISEEISVDDLRLQIRENIRPWNWCVRHVSFSGYFFEEILSVETQIKVKI